MAFDDETKMDVEAELMESESFLPAVTVANAGQGQGAVNARSVVVSVFAGHHGASALRDGNNGGNPVNLGAKRTALNPFGRTRLVRRGTSQIKPGAPQPLKSFPPASSSLRLPPSQGASEIPGETTTLVEHHPQPPVHKEGGLSHESRYFYSSARLRAVRQQNHRMLHGRSSLFPLASQSSQDQGKLTLVLDIDETLVHSRMNEQGKLQKNRYRQDEERKLLAETQGCDEFELVLSDGDRICVNKRPGLDEFLNYVGERFEVVAYTAGLEQYAKPLLDILDPDGKIFKHRLYRDSCLFIGGYYVKDLEKLNRDLGRCVLVDNNVYCFLPQLSNGIPISSFYDDPNDDALKVLRRFLDEIDCEADVRPVLERSFKLNHFLKKQRDEVIG